MKQTMRYISMIVLLLSSIMAWADDRVVIVAPTNGTIAVDKANPTGTVTVTLTVTPTAGQYFITLADIKVEKTASVAQTRADGPAIVGDIAAVAASVDDTGKGTYTFDLPEGYGARVIATFTECSTFVPTVAINNWTYGSTAEDPVITGNTSGGTESFTYSIKGANSYSATVPTKAGDYTVKACIAFKGHYKAAEATADFTIGKKDVTVSGIKASNKEYDGTKNATLDYSGVVYDGIEDGDVLTLTATGTFDDEEMGEGKTVNISGLTLGGSSAANYQLAATGHQTTTTADITQITLTAAKLNSKISLSSKSLGYTGSPIAPTVTITGMTEGTDYTVKYKDATKEATATKPTNYGNYTIVIVGIGYYTGEIVTSSTFMIDKAAPTVTTAPVAKTGLVYNGEAQALITAGVATGGTMVYTLDGAGAKYATAIPEAKDAGDYTVYYMVTGDTNHGDTEVATIKVSIAPVTLNASSLLDGSKIKISSNSLVYTGEPQAPLVTIEGLTEGVDYIVKYKNSNGETSTEKPTASGTYAIIIVGIGNYSGEIDTGITFIIEDDWPEIVDELKPVAIDGMTFYELTDETLETIKKNFTAEIALPVDAAKRATVMEDGTLEFSQGTDLLMAIKDLQYHYIIKFFFTGRLFGDSSHIRLKSSDSGTRAAGDMELYSGVPYEVKYAGDMLVTLKLEDKDATLLAVLISVPQQSTTGINTVGVDDGTAIWYDLQGQRIKQPVRKGIYIQDGKKVIVR